MPGITFDPQLDGDRTEAWDCGVESLAMALDAMSGGSVHPDSATIRRWMGGDKDTTNPWDWARACRSSQARRAFRRRGLTPPKVAIADGLDLDQIGRAHV